MSGVFEDSYITNKNSKTTIRGKIAYQGVESLGNLVFQAVFYAFPALIIYYFPVFRPTDIYIKIVLIPIVIILTWLLLHKFFQEHIQSVPLIVIDKSNNLLASVQDKSETKLSEIKKLDIIEEATENGNTLYKLHFKLDNGEKTSKFAFLSFSTAERAVNEINKAI